MKQTTSVANAATAKTTGATKTTKTTTAVTLDILTSKEAELLYFLSSEMEGFRQSEPKHSFAGLSTIRKHFNWNAKVATELSDSLVKKHFLTFDADNKVFIVEWSNLPKKLDDILELVVPETTKEKKATPAPTKKNVKEEKAVENSEEEAVARPYGKFGAHGKNYEIEGWEQGEPIAFKLGGVTRVGEYRHMHVNNHSPNGYIVIKHNGRIRERSYNSISKPTKAEIKAEKELTALEIEKENKKSKKNNH